MEERDLMSGQPRKRRDGFVSFTKALTQSETEIKLNKIDPSIHFQSSLSLLSITLAELISTNKIYLSLSTISINEKSRAASLTHFLCLASMFTLKNVHIPLLQILLTRDCVLS